MPQQIYDFVAINRMESFTIRENTKKKVDVCGIITSADTEITTLVSNKTGKDMYKVCFTDNMEYTVFNIRYCLLIRFRENLSSWIIQRHRFH